MPNVSEIMSIDVQVIEPQDTLRRAAQLMQQLDVGALPVCNGEQLLGMITDRDITVRGVADGLDTDEACVSDVMSGDVQFCTEDQDAQDVMRMMGDKQVRRMPVLDVDKRLVGIVSLGDMALRQPGHVDQAVREISEPAGPSMQGGL
jgi:CBS-domain-containing membrane protein